MPGILPMKLIRASTTSQARIAQACDRCRSKKIRCDGLTPTCTQCANVGFECKTSDKLSRRAFPRGYTESLEDRVRALETEVRELKDLLDEKDEKIDMLSKIHAQSLSPTRRASCVASQSANTRRSSAQSDKSDMFKAHQPSSLLPRGGTGAVFMGNSSGRVFIDAFTRKFQEAGKSCPDFDSGCFYPQHKSSMPSIKESKLWRPPPRLMSDQLVNIYFQEWAPLFPILHRPSFLELYERYTSDPASVTDKCSLAQLSLVFGIAAASSEYCASYPIELFEKQWTTAIESFMLEPSIKNLQCLVLALLFSVQRNDSNKILHYKGLAVGIAQRLGLHMSQKRFAFGALTVETRKKVFWTLYTLDCFTAAVLGLPKLIREDDIHCEYPVDADDEYVTEEGFKPTLPGEYTKLSSALALFRVSRLLAKVLEENYPASTSHDLSLRDISELDEELRAWQDALPAHLRMEFVHDKPSVQVMNSRGPLLCLTYHYIRTLIHRPVVCSNLGDRASSSLVSFASSSKCIYQIMQLLEERNLTFSFCLNKNELLTLSGFGVLFQALDLDKDSKLMKDNEKSFCSVAEVLGRRNAPGTAEFKRIGCSLLSVLRTQDHQELSKKAADVADVSLQTQKQLQALSARYSSHALEPKQRKPTSLADAESMRAPPDTLRKRSLHKEFSVISNSASISLPRRPSSQTTCTSTSSEAGLKRESIDSSGTTSYDTTSFTPNLDFFPLINNGMFDQRLKFELTPDEVAWEGVLSGFDDNYFNSHSSGFTNELTAEAFLAPTQTYHPQLQPPYATEPSWPTEFWGHGANFGVTPQPPSVLSFSDESFTSAEDLSSIDLSCTVGDMAYRGLLMPHYSPETLSPQALSDFEALNALVGL